MRIIGEALNSSDPVVHQALTAGDRATVESLARRQAEAGCDVIDCCATSLASAEASVLQWMVEVVEVVTDRPVSVDSPNLEVLASVGQGRRRPTILNSVGLFDEWPAPVLDLVRGQKNEVVIQLRRGWNDVARGVEQRTRWTEKTLQRMEASDLAEESVLIDPVLLPLEAGDAQDILHFLTMASKRWPRIRWIVGLSNLTFGQDSGREITCEWLPKLRDAGLSAALMDVLDPDLVRMAQCG